MLQKNWFVDKKIEKWEVYLKHRRTIYNVHIHKKSILLYLFIMVTMATQYTRPRTHKHLTPGILVTNLSCNKLDIYSETLVI